MAKFLPTAKRQNNVQVQKKFLFSSSQISPFFKKYIVSNEILDENLANDVAVTLKREKGKFFDAALTFEMIKLIKNTGNL